MKKNIAVLGTGSDVGKSIIAAGVCRSLADRGIKVAPFKSQNMSNNSGITPEGLEMGRAQIVQAEAARIHPQVDMNPILLKPTGEKQSQVILNGLVHDNQTAMDYHHSKEFYYKEACSAFDRLSEKYDRIVLEGAGSCAEVNLMPSDIVNFAMAEYAEANVVLVADIHRGGVFAQLVGTLECLPPSSRKRIKGFIINRFRGDIALFKDGVEWIEKKTKKKVFGVLPWYSHFKIDAEDSVEIEECGNIHTLDQKTPAVAVIRLPHIANFTDFRALSEIKGLQTIFIDSPQNLSRFKAIIIPGSKNTRADLDWLKAKFESPLKEFHRGKGHILGICGGYQMLGTIVEDPLGLEGKPGNTEGLGLLPVKTLLKAPKTTTVSEFEWEGRKGKGYEIHMGFTELFSGTPFLCVSSRNTLACDEPEGCLSNDELVAGTYVHGFFDYPSISLKWLTMIGLPHLVIEEENHTSKKEKDYDLLKIHFEKYIDLETLY
ncbi:MAG: cobyric acid synthase CobQ [Desulfobacteraceae bacterium 4572_89]|nr:MAG: cobyric acid synthase CobQ [Desulfobacteraceae bacterium 4572_89]